MNPMNTKNIWEVYKQEQHPEKKKEIRRTIITQYVDLVKIISGKLYNYYASNIEYEDLMGYGVVGLIDAIDRYDHTKNIKFETYASIRIRGSIIDQIRNLDWIPRTIRQKAKMLSEASELLENQLGREPRTGELAAYLNKTESEVLSLIDETAVYNVLSIEDEFNDSFKIQLSDNSPESSPEAYMENQESIKELQLAIEELNERERMIINLYYYENLTYKEIGEILGVSESRVSQIHSKAILKMRKKFGR